MSKQTQQERFLMLVEENRKILYKVANAYCWEAAERADLVQEMVLQLWRAFDRYDDTRRFSTWMYRVALNVAISYVRRESRRWRHRTPAGESILEGVAASESLVDQQDQQLLHEVIAGLNEMDRALVILHLDGYRYDEIGEVLGISASNAGTRLNRIKERLRREHAGVENRGQERWNSMS